LPYIAIEIVDLPIENGGSFHSYVNVYQKATITIKFGRYHVESQSSCIPGDVVMLLGFCAGLFLFRTNTAGSKFKPNLPFPSFVTSFCWLDCGWTPVFGSKIMVQN
jgi:hypothetical protein